MPTSEPTFFRALKARRTRYDPASIAWLFQDVDRARVESLSASLAGYIRTNLPAAIERRETLADYRTNPYVLMTSASVMKLDSPKAFAQFLFNSKLYMALETSFGKSIEQIFDFYPVSGREKWATPKEKTDEFKALSGRTREQRARLRLDSVWREVDKSVIVGNRRYLVSVKSGPNTINDTQVQAMADAIINNHRRWAQQTKQRYKKTSGLDIVIGLTYGTDRTTNNKENQVLVKLLEHGFHEESRDEKTGVVIDGATRSSRVYRVVGTDFWSFIGNPSNPEKARFVFLEVLLALAKALSLGSREGEIEDRLNAKMRELASALAGLQFPRQSLPKWIRDDFSDDELFWFATAMTAFYDEGI